MRHGGCEISSCGISLKMGKTYTGSEIERGLKRKGFVEELNDHRYLRFVFNGKKTHIRTMVSHSRKDVTNYILARMAEQCALSIREFRSLVDCALGEDEYGQRVEKLRATRKLPWTRGTRLPA